MPDALQGKDNSRGTSSVLWSASQFYQFRKGQLNAEQLLMSASQEEGDFSHPKSSAKHKNFPPLFHKKNDRVEEGWATCVFLPPPPALNM